MKRVTMLIVASAVAIVGAHRADAAPYTVTDLGTLGGTWSHPLSVNQSGQVVGSSDNGVEEHGFLYTGGAMHDLGTLQGYHYSAGLDVNDAGWVVGNSAFHNASQYEETTRPFLYINGNMTYLGSLSGGDNWGHAMGINNAGQVVGTSRRKDGVTNGFLWSEGVGMTDLGNIGGYGYSSAAYSINDVGQVAGIASVDGVHERGFLWQNGAMTDLGDLWGGTANARAYRINNSGQVVGETWQDNSALARGFLWENEVMRDLDPLQTMGTWSQANGINDRGEVVGATSQGAFVWDSANGMRNLNSMLDSSGSGWFLSGCRDINDLGQIVGWGDHNGEAHAFLLTPVPEPSALIVWSLLGAVGICARRFRR